jgi:predicted XRE-type DNA-binding protein
MTDDRDVLMETKRREAEAELGTPIDPDEWRSGAVVNPGENPFAALGLPNAAERDSRSRLAARIKRIVRERDLKQHQVAELTGLSQSDVSKILRGQLRGFSESRLYDAIAALGYDVRVVVEFHERADHGAGRVEILEAQSM